MRVSSFPALLVRTHTNRERERDVQSARAVLNFVCREPPGNKTKEEKLTEKKIKTLNKRI